ncbi:Hypothetical protein ORPV_325 [Orpheovirus IHUMI-LCC2]|uniref:Uncharacterized protein n=1 Tax=Orpheovirus IHUMI-LCC2 TaxID=2023057 RepID=A0A2I2L438_9VIRU|nr:Hypothetical protein ORPV_325 [Orpheovirus IHUMI-LCC2]SNW62229.1 Hypothetical protein ORPV_325 [Orpheovirus IHUMI-LCC2]
MINIAKLIFIILYYKNREMEVKVIYNNKSIGYIKIYPNYTLLQIYNLLYPYIEDNMIAKFMGANGEIIDFPIPTHEGAYGSNIPMQSLSLNINSIVLYKIKPIDRK